MCRIYPDISLTQCQWTNLVCLSKPRLSTSALEGCSISGPAPPSWAHAHIHLPPSPVHLPATLTCALADPVKELPGPSLSVVQVAQDVRTAPGPGVGLHLRAPVPALQGAADVGGVGAQRWAALLGPQAAHRHADPGELRPGPRWERTGQAAEQKPPPKGAHGFRTGRTLCLSRLHSLLLSSFLLVFHSWALEHSPAF